MIVRVNSHRANVTILQLFPDARSVYLREKMESGYYVLPPDSDISHIKGVSKPRIQDETRYANAWKASSR